MKTNKNLYKQTFDNILPSDNFKMKLINISESSGTKKHKRISKTVPLLVAVILIVSLFSATVYATFYTTVDLKSFLGYLFSGDSDEGFYSEGNPETSSSNIDYNIDIIGITGESPFDACISYKITKADGSTFTDKENATINLRDGIITNESAPFINNIWSDSSGGVEYKFLLSDDNKSIIVYEIVERNEKLKGQRFKSSFENLQISYPEKHLNIYANPQDYKSTQLIEELSKKYNIGENQYISFHFTDTLSKSYELCIFNLEKIDSKFETSVTLDYKDRYSDFDFYNKTYTYKISDNDTITLTFKSATISRWCFNLKGTVEISNSSVDNLKDIYSSSLPENIQIIMNDNTQYTLYKGACNIKEISAEKYSIDMYYRIYNNQKIAFINYNDIKEIKFGDIVINPNTYK